MVLMNANLNSNKLIQLFYEHTTSLLVSGGKVVRHCDVHGNKLLICHRVKATMDWICQFPAVRYSNFNSVETNTFSRLVVSFCQLHKHN